MCIRDRCFARAQVVVDLAENPGTALGRPADHDRVGASVIQDAPGLFRRVDIAIGDQRDFQLGADGADSVIFRLARIAVCLLYTSRCV